MFLVNVPFDQRLGYSLQKCIYFLTIYLSINPYLISRAIFVPPHQSREADIILLATSFKDAQNIAEWRYKIEGRWYCTFIFEIDLPQFSTSEFPAIETDHILATINEWSEKNTHERRKETYVGSSLNE